MKFDIQVSLLLEFHISSRIHLFYDLEGKKNNWYFIVESIKSNTGKRGNGEINPSILSPSCSYSKITEVILSTLPLNEFSLNWYNF